eukprot:Gb_04670 [translate_table: standard]
MSHIYAPHTLPFFSISDT